MSLSQGHLKKLTELTSSQYEPNLTYQNVVYIPGSLVACHSRDFSPWATGQRFMQIENWHKSFINGPEKHYLSTPDQTKPNQTKSTNASNDDFQQSNVNMPPPLPLWIWTVFVTILGIGPNTCPERYSIATTLHVLTLSSAFLFGASGLFYNFYNAFSEFTNTSVLDCVARYILGLYWICLGIYANILAVRLFSNQKIVDCIRLHSKTFLKVSTTFIVMLLSSIVVIVNVYSDLYLLEDHKSEKGTSTHGGVNCASAGVNVAVCKIHFVSKIVYSCFCLLWNLLVVAIFLSLCRTHTISIRTFMKKLLNDTKIYVEFYKIQALEKQIEFVQSLSVEERQNQELTPSYQNIADTNIWDDDIVGFDQDSSGLSEVPSNTELLNSLKTMRNNTSDLLANEMELSHNVLDFLTTVNGEWHQQYLVSNGSYIPLTRPQAILLKPVDVPGLHSAPCILLSELVNGVPDLIQLALPSEAANGTINVDIYNFTNSKQLSVVMSQLGSVKWPDLKQVAPCRASFKSKGSGVFGGYWPVCTQIVNGEHPKLNLTFNCKEELARPEVLEGATPTIMTFIYVRNGSRFPLINLPSNYVSPCKS